MKIVSTELSKSGSGKILKRLLHERFYFEVYVVATELRQKNSNSSATLVEFFLYFRAQKDSNKTATKGGSLRR
jgi:hypothetical protein